MARSAKTATAAPDHRCPRCLARWTGFNTAHCGFGCHETFTGMTAFDKHQKSGRCVDPPQAGLVDAKRRYPCWTTPERVAPATDAPTGAEEEE